jgi:hypothetical protein
MSFPTAHVEESWQMAEFYNNKVYAFSITSFLQVCFALHAVFALTAAVGLANNASVLFPFWKGPQ